jgi:hypothetical protein
MANSSAPDSGYVPTNLPQDGPTNFIDASDVTTDIQGLTDRFNAHIHTVDTTPGAASITTSMLAVGSGASLINAQATFSTGALTNTSYGAIGTQISVTTTVANQIIWVNFGGSLHISKVSGGTYVNAKVAVLIAGVDKSATFESEAMAYVSGLADGDYYRWPLGFSVPFVIATPGATTIQLEGIKVYGASYSVNGTLSAFVSNP